VQVQVLFSIFGGKQKDFRGSSAASGCKGGRLFSPPSRGLCFLDAVIMQVFLARRRAVAAAAGGCNIFAVTEGPTRDAPAREMTSTDERCLVPRSNTLVGANAEAVAPKTRRRVAPLNGQEVAFSACGCTQAPITLAMLMYLDTLSLPVAGTEMTHPHVSHVGQMKADEAA